MNIKESESVVDIISYFHTIVHFGLQIRARNKVARMETTLVENES